MPKTDQAPDRMEMDRAFTQLMRTYADDVLRLCYLCLRERALAEDAMQDVFLKAYRHMAALRREESQKAWLMKIAVNTCRDVRRSAWLRHNDLRVSLDDLPPASCEFTAEDDSVVREVMRLKPKDREAILLRYYQDLTPEECARAMGMTPSGFYRRLRRAQAALKPRLERWVFDEQG